MVVVYNKLVRDRIPEIIEAAGESCRTSVLSDAEYQTRLRAKLDEELREYDASGDVEELVDLMEIIHALAQCQGIDAIALDELRRAKRERNGGFDRRLLLIDTGA